MLSIRSMLYEEWSTLTQCLAEVERENESDDKTLESMTKKVNNSKRHSDAPASSSFLAAFQCVLSTTVERDPQRP